MRIFSIFLIPLITLGLAFCALQNSFAETINGRVVRVYDGDTLTLLTSGKKQRKIRLYGLDAPEKKQAFGEKSRQALAALAANKSIRVDVIDSDRYGRSVGIAHLGGLNINRAMIERGFAWVYDGFCHKSFCAEWKGLEGRAKAAKKGLWRDRSPIPPWKWRRNGSGSSK